MTGGAGVDVVYDSVGKTTFEKSLACLRPRGMLVLFGQSSGSVPPLDPQVLNTRGSLFLTRPSLAHYLLSRDELLWRAGDVLTAVERGQLRAPDRPRLPARRGGRGASRAGVASDDRQARDPKDELPCIGVAGVVTLTRRMHIDCCDTRLPSVRSPRTAPARARRPRLRRPRRRAPPRSSTTARRVPSGHGQERQRHRERRGRAVRPGRPLRHDRGRRHRRIPIDARRDLPAPVRTRRLHHARAGTGDGPRRRGRLGGAQPGAGDQAGGRAAPPAPVAPQPAQTDRFAPSSRARCRWSTSSSGTSSAPSRRRRRCSPAATAAPPGSSRSRSR